MSVLANGHNIDNLFSLVCAEVSNITSERRNEGNVGITNFIITSSINVHE